jgi:hypothetical protein
MHDRNADFPRRGGANESELEACGRRLALQIFVVIMVFPKYYRSAATCRNQISQPRINANPRE